MLRTRRFLTLLASKCALRHNSVRLFNISTSKSGPSMVCFVHFDLEMCFAPQRVQLEPQIIGKTQCFATFLLFRAPASSFFSLFLFSDLLSSSLLFSSLTLPISAFPSVHIVGSLTSKLPSINMSLVTNRCVCIYIYYSCLIVG